MLPPRSPELNPVENIWQFMRDNWLSNRVFKFYNDILDHCCDAWNKLVDQPWSIMSIDMLDWAHRFSSMSIGISRGPWRDQRGAVLTATTRSYRQVATAIFWKKTNAAVPISGDGDNVPRRTFRLSS